MALTRRNRKRRNKKNKRLTKCGGKRSNTGKKQNKKRNQLTKSMKPTKYKQRGGTQEVVFCNTVKADESGKKCWGLLEKSG